MMAVLASERVATAEREVVVVAVVVVVVAAQTDRTDHSHTNRGDRHQVLPRPDHWHPRLQLDPPPTDLLN